MRKIEWLFIWLGVFFLFFFLIVGRPFGEELSEIGARNAAYCALYSRSEVLHDVLHGDAPTADTDYVLHLAQQHYAACLALLPTLLPVSDSLKSWLADVRDLIVIVGRERTADDGTAPATAGGNTWLEQCRREYSTFDEGTGTVVRKGSPERVRCPCGKEVFCE